VDELLFAGYSDALLNFSLLIPPGYLDIPPGYDKFGWFYGVSYFVRWCFVSLADISFSIYSVMAPNYLMEHSIYLLVWMTLVNSMSWTCGITAIQPSIDF
jgi:hypothetical protein